MSKATITYDLSNPEDREEFYRATKALDMAICLFEIQNVLRGWRKKDLNPAQEVIVDGISEEICSTYHDQGIELDKLIT